jgi:Ni,Fe-hydrogenase III component G
MKIDDVTEKLKQTFGDRIVGVDRKSDRRAYVTVDTKAIVPVAGYVFKDLDARFMISTGTDTPRGVMEVNHHFAFDRHDFVVTLRALVDRENPEIDSITSAVPAANWIEREMWELLGINFRNHPNKKHLLLADDWPEGDYPLRRDRKNG